VLTAACSLGGLVLVPAGPASASTITVNTTADGVPGSLRAAIDLANATPGPDTILVPPGHYTLTVAGNDEDNNATGDLDIKGDTLITGTGGAGVTTIDANGMDRAFHVVDGNTTLAGLTITRGSNLEYGGGALAGIFSDSLTLLDDVVKANHSHIGGGVASDGGSLTVTRSEILDNTATWTPGNGSVGGGIGFTTSSAGSTFTLSDSSVAGNHIVGGNGGGLSVAGTATITNSTITGNDGDAETGVELDLRPGHPVTLSYVTISDNVGSTGGFATGLFANAGVAGAMPVHVRGLLLTHNTAAGVADDCGVQQGAVIVSDGYNLADDTSCSSFNDPTDHTDDHGTTLGPLADHGGATRTRALLAGSSAIDAGGKCSVVGVTADQRGAARPAAGGGDIGAYEAVGVQAPPPSSTTTTTVPSTTTTTLPVTTTTVPSSTTTTVIDPPTIPADPATTTTVDPTTTTSVDPSTTTTVAPTSTTMPPGTVLASTTTTGKPIVVVVAAESTDRGSSDPLPVTGLDTPRALLLATLLLSLGGLLLIGSRRRAGTRLAIELAQHPEG
jgi:hypothetical protein